MKGHDDRPEEVLPIPSLAMGGGGGGGGGGGDGGGGMRHLAARHGAFEGNSAEPSLLWAAGQGTLPASLEPRPSLVPRRTVDHLRRFESMRAGAGGGAGRRVRSLEGVHAVRAYARPVDEHVAPSTTVAGEV